MLVFFAVISIILFLNLRLTVDRNFDMNFATINFTMEEVIFKIAHGLGLMVQVYFKFSAALSLGKRKQR